MKPPFAVLAAAALSIAGLGVPAAAVAARTSEPTVAALSGFSDIVTDPTHRQVFISEGSADDVVVTDSAGQLITTLSDLAGAAGMVLSPDASTLYVALPTANAIEMIDTATLAAASVSTGDNTCPSQVAVTDQALWFGYGCSSTDGGNLGEVDLPALNVHLGLIDAGYTGPAPILAADAYHLSGSLFVGQPGPYAGDVYLYDVTGGSAPTAAVRNHRIAGSSLSDMAVSPTGTQLAVAATANSTVRRFSTADLAPQPAFVTGDGPGAVSYRPDGMAAIGRGHYVPNVEIFKPGYAGKFRTYQLGTGSAQYVQPGGLAFGVTQLFAVTADYWGNNPELHVVLPKHVTTLTIRTNKPVYSYNDAATVTVHLGYTVSGRQVTISATPYGGKAHIIKQARVDASGNLTAVAHVLKRTTFTATFAGDAQSEPAHTSVGRQVHARVTNTLRGFYGKSGIYHLYHLNDNPVLWATVVPHAPGTCVYFRGQYLVNGVWKTGWTTGCGHLDSHSRQWLRLIGDHWVDEHVRMRAEWRNHPANLGAVGPWQYSLFTASAKSAGTSASGVKPSNAAGQDTATQAGHLEVLDAG